jgi:hypothetical protein
LHTFDWVAGKDQFSLEILLGWEDTSLVTTLMEGEISG